VDEALAEELSLQGFSRRSSAFEDCVPEDNVWWLSKML
jgi:hypothetical protein